MLRALPRDLGCYRIYCHADFVRRMSEAVAQGLSPYMHAGFMTQLLVAFSDPRSLDARRTARYVSVEKGRCGRVIKMLHPTTLTFHPNPRGEVAIRVKLWSAQHLLQQQLSNVCCNQSGVSCLGNSGLAMVEAAPFFPTPRSLSVEVGSGHNLCTAREACA